MCTNSEGPGETAHKLVLYRPDHPLKNTLKQRQESATITSRSQPLTPRGREKKTERNTRDKQSMHEKHID